MLAIRVPKDVESRLDSLAKRTGRTKTFYVREAILQHLEDLEDRYDADRALKLIQDGKMELYPLEEVERRLGLAR